MNRIPDGAEKPVVIGLDAGGTCFKASLVNVFGEIMSGSSNERRVDTNGSRESVLESYADIVRMEKKIAEEKGVSIAGIGISTPGPFHYENAASQMTHKFKNIYGVNLRAEIRNRCQAGEIPILFLHDSHAFLMGEYCANDEVGAFQNVAGITLGTGTGFALIRSGRLLENENGGPYISIYGRPYQGKTVDDYLSARGIIRLYSELSGRSADEGFDVKNIEYFAAKNNDRAALEAFSQTGAYLADMMREILREQEIECFVLGGQISKGYPLMEASISKGLEAVDTLKKICPGKNINFSAQIGAADMIFKHINMPMRRKGRVVSV